MPLQVLCLISDQREYPHSVPTTQCQRAAADPDSVARHRGVRPVRLEVDGAGKACSAQVAVMSAIYVLEVQFDNSVQFQAESKILLPVGFTLGDEELAALSAGKGFVGQMEAHLMK